jgi:hypothetical protein
VSVEAPRSRRLRIGSALPLFGCVPTLFMLILLSCLVSGSAPGILPGWRILVGAGHCEPRPMPRQAQGPDDAFRHDDE